MYHRRKRVLLKLIIRRIPFPHITRQHTAPCSSLIALSIPLNRFLVFSGKFQYEDLSYKKTYNPEQVLRYDSSTYNSGQRNATDATKAEDLLIQLQYKVRTCHSLEYIINNIPEADSSNGGIVYFHTWVDQKQSTYLYSVISILTSLQPNVILILIEKSDARL